MLLLPLSYQGTARLHADVADGLLYPPEFTRQTGHCLRDNLRRIAERRTFDLLIMESSIIPLFLQMSISAYLRKGIHNSRGLN